LFNAGEFDDLKELIAMSNAQVNQFLDTQIPAGEDDFEPSPTPKYDVKVGDVWLLGKHRLMCGDATNPEHLNILMGGAIADMVFTDPPYGVSYTGTNNPNGKDWSKMENDELRGDALYKFLFLTFKNLFDHTSNSPAIYVCYASINHTIFETALEEAGFKVKQQLIWDKGMVLGRFDYHWTHEPILYAIKKDKNCTWFGDRAEQTMIRKGDDLSKLSKQELIEILEQLKEGSTIIKLRKDFAGFYIHPTQKPVSLPRRCIGNSSLEGFKILEPFCGSGSTLIACEQLIDRTCYAMELDPRYVSGIIGRWEELTKNQAKKVE
jgi:DNA modification methylase